MGFVELVELLLELEELDELDELDELEGEVDHPDAVVVVLGAVPKLSNSETVGAELVGAINRLRL